MRFPTSELLGATLSKALSLQPSTTTSVSIVVLVVANAWRHFVTSTQSNSFQQEAWIEWLSWIILFILQRLLNCPVPFIPQSEFHETSFWSSKSALWLVAATCVGSQVLSSQKLFASILPLTTIAVTLISRFSPSTLTLDGHGKGENDAEADMQEDLYRTSNVKEMMPKILLPIVLNLICCGLLMGHSQSLPNRAMILMNLLFLLVRSSAIIGISKLHQNPSFPGYTNETAQYIELLSLPMLALQTLVIVIVQPELRMSSAGALFQACVQAAWWAASIHLLRLKLTNSTANMDTVAQSAQLALRELDIQSISTALAALFISTAQSVLVLRPGSAARKTLYAAAMTFIIVFWLHEDPRLVPDSSSTLHVNFVGGHPIETLIAKNRARFDATTGRQSQDVYQAIREYRRRYKRAPPLGFAQWFEIAKANNFVLIDEFDTMMQSIEPLHGVHPSILQKRIEKAIELESGRLGVIRFKDKNLTMSEGITGLAEKLLDTALAEIVPYDMTLLINEWDEPMVSVPFDEISRAIQDAQDPQFKDGAPDAFPVNPLPFIETGKQNGWAATSAACPVDSASRQDQCPEEKFSNPLSFVDNATSAADICQKCDILHNHGLLLYPGNLKVAHELVPVWSASKPSHFHDILYPSAYYIAVRDDYKSELDSDWGDKDNKFYWVGTATGGWSTEKTWPLMQRQRLVIKTSKTNIDPAQFLEEAAPDIWQPRFSTMAEVSNLFETRISRIVQCEEDVCKAEETFFGLDDGKPTDPQDAAYAHKFVMDVDGNGFSGRYYRLLRSRSVVIKSTILKEWHDDRLIPWVHYVPLSTSYTELPEMARFLAGTERGLHLSERIARESTEWHDQALRDIDLRLVWLRMLLEFGRIMQPELTM